MSPAATRMAQQRHMRDQVRECLLSWPLATAPTRAQVDRLRKNASDLDESLRGLAIKLIDEATHGH